MIKDQVPKTEKLKKILGEMGSILVSFSGGVDSALLLHVATEVLENKVIAATFISPLFPKADLARAENLIRELKVSRIEILFDILSNEDFIKNDPLRCHFCKTRMVERLGKEAEKHGIHTIVDGANLDDLRDYRPGLKASQKAGIRSPLIEAGFTKQDIRKEAQKRALALWNTPASACLASRIAFGTPIREKDLTMIGHAEAILHELDFKEVRVRYHPPVARIEVSSREIRRLTELPIRKKVIQQFKGLGFTYVTLDLSGYRGGSMNEVLP
jgi:uncharacterized protein